LSFPQTHSRSNSTWLLKADCFTIEIPAVRIPFKTWREYL
jgi:hypothetical protein